METAQLFLITAFAALIGVLPPGIINIYAVKLGYLQGKKEALKFATGASALVMIQALLAYYLAKYLIEQAYFEVILLRTGFVILLLLFAYFSWSGYRNRQAKEKIELKTVPNKSFWKGVGLQVINLLPIPYFIIIKSLFNLKGERETDQWTLLFFVFAAGIGTFTALYLYIYSFLKLNLDIYFIKRYANLSLAFLIFILLWITFFRIWYIEV